MIAASDWPRTIFTARLFLSRIFHNRCLLSIATTYVRASIKILDMPLN